MTAQNSKPKSGRVADETAKIQRGKPFQSGRSGNPNGRPAGSRNKTTEMVEKLLKGDAEKVTRAVLEAAANGDMRAATIVLDRIAPVRKGRPIAVDLPKLETAADVSAAMAAVVLATAQGALTPTEAGELASVIDIHRRAIETGQLAARIAALEEPKEGKR